MAVIKEVRKRIGELCDGEVVMTADFADLACLTTIRKCLGRCCDEGIIRRVFDGVYEKPKYSKLLNEYVPVNPEKVAYAIARNYHWTISPCGEIALNKLGLTTQVPVVWSYISDGPYRSFFLGNIKLEFKHRANREISQLSDQTKLIVEALRVLGKEKIDDDVILRLQHRISDSDKQTILSEAIYCSEWIYETIRKVCSK